MTPTPPPDGQCVYTYHLNLILIHSMFCIQDHALLLDMNTAVGMDSVLDIQQLASVMITATCVRIVAVILMMCVLQVKLAIVIYFHGNS